MIHIIINFNLIITIIFIFSKFSVDLLKLLTINVRSLKLLVAKLLRVILNYFCLFFLERLG